MIGRLTGTITKPPAGGQTNQIIIDINGVGYLVHSTSRDISQLPSQPQKKSKLITRFDCDTRRTDNSQLTTLYVHTYVKEDTLTLFGFLNEKDLELFQYLITVSGVGPKLALTILSQHTAEQIKSAISTADTNFFKSISGIGKKNAQKIIVELKSKFGSLKELDLSETDQQKHTDLIEALKSLGYTTREIKPLLEKIPQNITKIEEQIKYLLKNLPST